MADAPQLIQNAAITDPTALATSIASSGWNDWKNNLSHYLQGSVSKSAASTDAIASSNLQAAGKNSSISDGMMGDYNSIYRPAGAKFGAEIDQMGTEAYQQQQRGQAVADVQSNIDSQLSQANRSMSRMGVNPSSGRALAMNNQAAIAGAAAKASAAANSDRNVKSQYLAGLKDINGMGLNMTKAANGFDETAQRWSALGSDASQAGTKLGLDYAKTTATQADAYGTVAARAAGLLNSNATTASQIQAAKDANSIPNLLISGAVKAGSSALDGAMTAGGKYLADKATSGLSSYWNTPSAETVAANNAFDSDWSAANNAYNVPVPSTNNDIWNAGSDDLLENGIPY